MHQQDKLYPTDYVCLLFVFCFNMEDFPPHVKGIANHNNYSTYGIFKEIVAKTFKGPEKKKLETI